MQASVKIVDWEPGAQRQARPALRLVSETLTAGELIAQRVKAEYRAMEATERTDGEKPGFAAWLVVPGAREQKLNGNERLFGPGVLPKMLGADDCIEIARKALASGQFVMLFDGRQIEDWEERILIRPDSLATFIKLTPLRGG